MPTLDLAFVHHTEFGTGAVFGRRMLDCGAVADVWFDGQVRTVLGTSLVSAPRPEVLSKPLRVAFGAYKKARRIKRDTEDRPASRPVSERKDVPSWRRTFEFDGAEDALAEETAA